jgi:hypothetical protein
MCKRIIVLNLLIFSILNLSAQEEIVTKIRKAYTEYNTQLEKYKAEGTDFLPAKYEINTVQNRPALGPVQVKFSYYFDEVTKEVVGEEPDILSTEGFLRKVVYFESMPSFIDYREFFYDEKGNIIFYYSKLTGYTCGEKRFYFDKGKMIKIKFNPITDKDCGDEKFPDFTRTTGKFTKDDLDWEKWVLKVASYHNKAFLNMFETTQ